MIGTEKLDRVKKEQVKLRACNQYQYKKSVFIVNVVYGNTESKLCVLL